MLYMLFFCPKSLRTILLTDMAALSLAACMSNGLEAVSATNDTAGEAEAGTEKKAGRSREWQWDVQLYGIQEKGFPSHLLLPLF